MGLQHKEISSVTTAMPLKNVHPALTLVDL